MVGSSQAGAGSAQHFPGREAAAANSGTGAPTTPGPSRRDVVVTAALAATLVSVGSSSGAQGTAPASSTQPVAPAVRVIRLGQSLPLSGEYSVLGRAYRDAAAATFDELNQLVRETGLRYELTSMDDRGRAELTESNSRRLIETAGVHVLFGFGGEGAGRVGALSAEAAGLPYVAPVSGSVELRTPRRRGTFVCRASHADEIRYIVNHAQLIGVTRLAMVYELTFLGLEMRNALMALLDDARRADTVLSVIDTAGSDYTVPGAVDTVIRGQPQAIVLGSNDVATSAFVRALRQAGYKGYLYALSSVGSQGLARRLGPLATGISVTQVVPFPLTGALRVSRNHQAFCERQRIEPSFHTMEGWIGATLFHEAMKRLRVVKPNEIALALASAPEYDFGGHAARWLDARPGPAPRVSLTVYDREGRLRA